MKKVFLSTSFIFLSLIQIYAQDTLITDTVKNLVEVIVTYKADNRSPISFHNINSESIDQKSIGQEPSFLFSETPSVSNYSDGGNAQGYSYYRIRGIDQTRINTTLDGMPMNEPEDQGAYFSNYPDILNSVSKIQIQRGVASSKNGVASFGGSIQLFSPNLADTSRIVLGLGYGSYNSFRVFGEYNSGIKNKKAMYVRASQIYSDGYKYNSSNNSQSVFFSSGLYYDKSIWKINILTGQQQNELAWIGVSESKIKLDPKTNGNSNQEKDRFFQSLVQIQNRWQINSFYSLQSSIYYTFLKGNYGFDYNNYIGQPSTEELYNYAFLSHLAGIFSNVSFSKKNLNFAAGFHGYIYNRQHTGSEKSLGKLYQNVGHKNEQSFFSKFDYTFNRFNFFSDVQYRYVTFDYKGSVPLSQLNWHFINPIAGLSVSINPYSIIYYSIGYTGREPTRNDMFGGNDDLLADSLGNPIVFNTKAENVLNHELGFRFLKGKTSLSANLYYMNFENEIVLDGKFGPNGLALTNNVEKSFRTGLELSLDYKISKYFSLVNNSSFNYSRIKEQSEIFSPILTPPIIINQEAIFSKNYFSLALSMRYQDHSFIDFANENIVNRYFLMNARASCNIRGFQVSLFLNNITNAKYFNHGYVDFNGVNRYFVQAPINIFGSIQYSFK